jgi:hypothetical protein
MSKKPATRSAPGDKDATPLASRAEVRAEERDEAAIGEGANPIVDLLHGHSFP